jgi:hypothetical protein
MCNEVSKTIVQYFGIIGVYLNPVFFSASMFLLFEIHQELSLLKDLGKDFFHSSYFIRNDSDPEFHRCFMRSVEMGNTFHATNRHYFMQCHSNGHTVESGKIRHT